MTRRNSSSDLTATIAEVGAIFWLTPLIMANRLAQMASGSPLEAFVSMHGFAQEKMAASVNSATALTMEAMRQSTRLAHGRGDAGVAAQKLIHAAIEPVSRQVRANAAGPGSKKGRRSKG